MELWLSEGCALGEHICTKFEEFCELLGMGSSLGKVYPLWEHSVDRWTPGPSTWSGPLVSFFLQSEVTKEGPTRETRILAESSMEGKASKAERELLEEP